MFLHLLNEPQQKALLALTKQFIETDRNLADAEQNLLELMYAESGLDFGEELPGDSLETLAAAFDTKQARAAALLEILGVGHADEEFSPEESAFVSNLAEHLGLTEDQVRAMESWVSRQIALAREAESFWAE